jgi:hypothetical protein
MRDERACRAGDAFNLILDDHVYRVEGMSSELGFLSSRPD